MHTILKILILTHLPWNCQLKLWPVWPQKFGSNEVSGIIMPTHPSLKIGFGPRLGLGLVLGLREGWLAGFPETKLGPKVLQCCN